MPSDAPRIALLDGPTPFEPMPRIGAHAGHLGLWVKRDDCMPLALGGNKVRSLEYWLGAAEAQGCDILVVAGAPASNQVRLTAAAAAKRGLDCLVLYAGAETLPDHPNRRLTEMMGAQIRSLGPVDEEERGRMARSICAELAAAGHRPSLIGDPVVGALGYARAAQELHAQSQERGVPLRHIVLPGSMGVTEAGMIFGAARMNLPWIFHLVSVEYDAPVLERRLAAILDGLCRAQNVVLPGDPLGRVRIRMDQLGGGYGVPTEASREASRLFGRLEALILEQTYVAKTFAGLLAVVARDEIPPGEAACILHTGGTPAVLA